MSERKNKCPICNGTGIKQRDDGSSYDCPHCEGTGLRVIGVTDNSDVMDKLNDVLNKCDDILEQVTEP